MLHADGGAATDAGAFSAGDDDDSQLLVLVAPCNRPRDADGMADADKLELVQRLICGAGEAPVILLNPDMEALLLTRRIGKEPAPPMFLSDFEHVFFLAEAEAKLGHVTAVRRLWREPWEVYRVERAGAEGSPLRATSVERAALAHQSDVMPRAADVLTAHVRQRQRRRRRSNGVPGTPAHEVAWEAEDGWGLR